jgi:competence ComEA-like helix-hairpin-helix protein
MVEYRTRKELALADTLDDTLQREYNPYNPIALSSHYQKKEEKKTTYFDFDPNKIGVEEWIRLGFTEKQAESIEKLKSKGFKFYKPEDLKTVYVVGEANYNRLAPYIKIDQNNFSKREYAKPVYPEKPKEKFVIDINTADSSLFERQKGIGPALASRIIKYRNRLGGFVSTEQIKEVWGMPDSTFQYLKERLTVNEIKVAQLNLNTTDFETLRKHPYINYTFAKVIEAYRRQHGNFVSTDDLKKIPIITDSIYRKLLPYVAVSR